MPFLRFDSLLLLCSHITQIQPTGSSTVLTRVAWGLSGLIPANTPDGARRWRAEYHADRTLLSSPGPLRVLSGLHILKDGTGRQHLSPMRRGT
ncbi:hypothetical protein F4861DRAFT_139660 [Xylaria intraflava]|nr:hypothetical protein F4861DRAFT_139660 [Xylaria intraflava]